MSDDATLRWWDGSGYIFEDYSFSSCSGCYFDSAFGLNNLTGYLETDSNHYASAAGYLPGYSYTRYYWTV